MNDYKKIEDILAAINETWINGTSLCRADYLNNKIKTLPSADVVERKRGKWEEIGNCYDVDGTHYYTCSVCGGDVATSELYNFCPNCGADMRGEEYGN